MSRSVQMTKFGEFYLCAYAPRCGQMTTDDPNNFVSFLIISLSLLFMGGTPPPALADKNRKKHQLRKSLLAHSFASHARTKRNDFPVSGGSNDELTPQPPTYVHTYIHTSMHTCMHANMQTHTHIHTYMHTYIPTYIHTFIHTFIHTYIHT